MPCPRQYSARVLDLILTSLAGGSIFLALWQFLAGVSFRLKRRDVPSEDTLPPVTILKPLKGFDSETERCLRSWLDQSYAAPVQILFGVASADDPVCALVERLCRHAPEGRAEMILCQPELGTNGKVSKLCHLAERARHSLLVISDADTAVAPDLLSRLIVPFSHPEVSLVNCFYQVSSPANLAMRLEAIAVNADFWTQVLQGLTVKRMDFALGAVVGVRRDALERIGGFRAISEYLADDFQLGHRIALAGGTLKLSSARVECRGSPQTPLQVWRHQARWATTFRVCRPIGYFFSILSNLTLWAVAAWLSGSPAGGPIALGAVAVRMLTAYGNYQNLPNKRTPLWVPMLAPVKDLFAVVLWANAFLHSTVIWQGERYKVDSRGKLTRLA